MTNQSKIAETFLSARSSTRKFNIPIQTITFYYKQALKNILSKKSKLQKKSNERYIVCCCPISFLRNILVKHNIRYETCLPKFSFFFFVSVHKCCSDHSMWINCGNFLIFFLCFYQGVFSFKIYYKFLYKLGIHPPVFIYAVIFVHFQIAEDFEYCIELNYRLLIAEISIF